VKLEKCGEAANYYGEIEYSNKRACPELRSFNKLLMEMFLIGYPAPI